MLEILDFFPKKDKYAVSDTSFLLERKGVYKMPIIRPPLVYKVDEAFQVFEGGAVRFLTKGQEFYFLDRKRRMIKLSDENGPIMSIVPPDTVVRTRTSWTGK